MRQNMNNNCFVSPIVNSRRAFTLVELLVVIAIIGMLAGLITVAAGRAITSARQSMIRTEIGQVDMAIEQYKNQHGEYPPDMYDDTAVVRHVKKRWPRFTFPSGATSIEDQALAVRQAISNVYANKSRYTDDLLKSWGTNAVVQYHIKDSGSYLSDFGCLAFWLGGFPDSTGKFQGLDADATAPFGKIYSDNDSDTATGINDGSSVLTRGTSNVVKIGTYDKKPVYDLQVGKNVFFIVHHKEKTSFPYFGNKLPSGKSVPYLYFRAIKDAGPLAYTYCVGGKEYNVRYYTFTGMFADDDDDPEIKELGIATPYADICDPFATNGKPWAWLQGERFQILHPGLDGRFGGGVLTDQTNNYKINPSSSNSPEIKPDYFRSVDPNATGNTLAAADNDNITNVSSQPRLDSLAP